MNWLFIEGTEEAARMNQNVFIFFRPKDFLKGKVIFWIKKFS